VFSRSTIANKKSFVKCYCYKKESVYDFSVQLEQYNPSITNFSVLTNVPPDITPDVVTDVATYDDDPTMEDPNFVPAFQKGEEWVFLELARKFRNPIFHYVRGRIGNREASEDVTQEIFLKIYRFRQGYDPSFRFTSWLWTIVRNATTDWRKKEKPRNPGDEPFGSSQTPIVPVEEFPCSKPNAERLLLQDGKLRTLRRALSKLTRLQRRVLWLRVVHQLSCSEIAEQLDISLSAVKCAMYRARISAENHLQMMTVI